MYIGRLFGIEIRLSVWVILSVPLLLIFGNTGLFLSMFMSVFLHELAHIFVARMLNVRVQGLEVMPLGGVAHIDGLEYAPHKAEVVIALAGPFFSFFSATACIVTGDWFTGLQPAVEGYARCSLILAAFNMLPAFPLDGGRVLRGILSSSMNELKATNICAVLGAAIGIGLTAVGIYYSFKGQLKLNILGIGLLITVSALTERLKSRFAIAKTYTKSSLALEQHCGLPVKHIAASPYVMAGKLAAGFRANSYYIIYVLDKSSGDGRHINQDQLFKGMIRFGADVSDGKIAKWIDHNLDW